MSSLRDVPRCRASTISPSTTTWRSRPSTQQISIHDPAVGGAGLGALVGDLVLHVGEPAGYEDLFRRAKISAPKDVVVARHMGEGLFAVEHHHAVDAVGQAFHGFAAGGEQHRLADAIERDAVARGQGLDSGDAGDDLDLDVEPLHQPQRAVVQQDRKSTRLNSSHTVISYAVFCLKKKKNTSHGKRGRNHRDVHGRVLRGREPLHSVSGGDGQLFFFNDTATTEIYTLSLHDALPICLRVSRFVSPTTFHALGYALVASGRDRKSTRLNSSHTVNSYAVFCLTKKNTPLPPPPLTPPSPPPSPTPPPTTPP